MVGKNTGPVKEVTAEKNDTVAPCEGDVLGIANSLVDMAKRQGDPSDSDGSETVPGDRSAPGKTRMSKRAQRVNVKSASGRKNLKSRPLTPHYMGDMKLINSIVSGGHEFRHYVATANLPNHTLLLVEDPALIFLTPPKNEKEWNLSVVEKILESPHARKICHEIEHYHPTKANVDSGNDHEYDVKKIKKLIASSDETVHGKGSTSLKAVVSLAKKRNILNSDGSPITPRDCLRILLAVWHNNLTEFGIHLHARIFSHSRSPNCVRYFPSDVVEVRTLRSVRAGEPLTVAPPKPLADGQKPPAIVQKMLRDRRSPEKRKCEDPMGAAKGPKLSRPDHTGKKVVLGHGNPPFLAPGPNPVASSMAHRPQLVQTPQGFFCEVQSQPMNQNARMVGPLMLRHPNGAVWTSAMSNVMPTSAIGVAPTMSPQVVNCPPMPQPQIIVVNQGSPPFFNGVPVSGPPVYLANPQQFMQASGTGIMFQPANKQLGVNVMNRPVPPMGPGTKAPGSAPISHSSTMVGQVPLPPPGDAAATVPPASSPLAVGTQPTVANVGPFPGKVPICITKRDVICGKGASVAVHNQHFQRICAKHVAAYASTKKRGIVGKKGIALSVINQVHVEGGRFLRKTNRNEWVELTLEEATEKVCHCFRDMVRRLDSDESDS